MPPQCIVANRPGICPGQSRDLTNFKGLSRDPGITLLSPGISCFMNRLVGHLASVRVTTC